MTEIKHLPYVIDEMANRFHSYETLWKKVGLSLLMKHLASPTGLTLLDYGCGRGEFMNMAKTAGFQVCGCDIDPVCVELSSRFGPAKLLEGPSLTSLFDTKIDVIASFHVLEHVENPKQTLLQMRDIAQRYLLIAVPNLARFPKLRWSQVGYPNTGHLQSWDHATWLNLAENHCGLKLIEWGFDAVVLGSISYYLEKLLGEKSLIKLERGFFRSQWPQWSTSIIGLFEKRS